MFFKHKAKSVTLRFTHVILLLTNIDLEHKLFDFVEMIIVNLLLKLICYKMSKKLKIVFIT